MSKNVEVRLSANTLQYQKAMRDAGTSTDAVATSTTKTTSAVGSSWGKLGGSITSSMGLSYAAVGAAAVAAGAYAVKAASNLQESINAVNVSYGDSAKAVHALGEDATDSFGLSQRAFNDAAVSFTNFAEDVAGDGGDVASTLNDLMLRSTDFASVMNMDVTAAANAFKSALSGEAEPLKQFGINISEAAVKSYALEKGLIGVGDAMTDQEKVQARYGLLMQETEKTAGDFAATSDGYAGAMKKAKAEAENLAASLGAILIPALAEVLSITADASGAVADFLESAPVSWTFNTISDIPSTLDDFENAIWGFAGDITGIDIDPFGNAVDSAYEFSTSTDLVAESIAAALLEVKMMNSAQDYAVSSYSQVTAAIEDAQAAMDAQTEAANKARTANRELADGTYGLYDAEDALAAAIATATEVLGDHDSSLRDIRAANGDVAQSVDDVVTKQIELDGTVRDSVRGQQLWNESMMANASMLSGPMQTEVLAHIGRVNGIPSDKLTTILTDADPNDIAQVQGELDALAIPIEVPVDPVMPDGDWVNRWAEAASAQAGPAGASIGTALSAGVAAGLNSNAYVVAAASSSVVKTALDAALKSGRISSPSRLFAEEVGAPISAGIAEGIVEDADKISRSLSKAIEAAEEDANDAAEDLADAALDAFKAHWSSIEGWDTFGNTQRGVGDAERGVEDARRKEADAVRDIADAEANLASVRADGESTTRDVANAERKVADAMRSHEDAVRRIEDAIRKLEGANLKLLEATTDSLSGDEASRLSWIALAGQAGLTETEIRGLVKAYDDLAVAQDAAAIARIEIAEEAIVAQGVRTQFDGVVAANLISKDKLDFLGGKSSGEQLDWMKLWLNELAILFGQVPQYADGGVVPGPPSQGRLAVVHGGELITPAGQGMMFPVGQMGSAGSAGGSSLTINHYGPTLSAADVSRGYTLARLAQVA